MVPMTTFTTFWKLSTLVRKFVEILFIWCHQWNAIFQLSFSWWIHSVVDTIQQENLSNLSEYFFFLGPRTSALTSGKFATGVNFHHKLWCDATKCDAIITSCANVNPNVIPKNETLLKTKHRKNKRCFYLIRETIWW